MRFLSASYTRSVQLLVLVWFILCGHTIARADEAQFIVEPAKSILRGNLARLQLVVTGTTPDGLQVGMTRAAQFETLTPDIVSVSSTGLVTARGNGAGRIRVSHAKQDVEVPIEVASFQPNAAVSFTRDVIPILSHAGCNSGACHASQFGQGGMKFSLLGYAPEQDHAPLVRERQQRRISLVRPADSLILRKAILAVSHGGGKRFNKGSYGYQVLEAWLRAGVPGPSKNELSVVGLTVTPKERVFRLNAGQQLRVVAKYSDGSKRDVSNHAIYDSLGDAVAKVDKSGYITAVGHGQAAVMVRFQGQAKVSLVVSPFAADVDLSGFQPNNFIDQKVKSRWGRLNLQPVAICSDEEFVRRAFLDAIGTLPTPQRTQQFLTSTASDKRDQLIDEILGMTGDSKRDVYVREWSAYWALKWGDLVRNNRQKLGDGGMWSFYNWIRKSLREGMPVDQFVREIITAQGSIYENGPANYYKIARKPEDLAETTAQVFLGVRLQCARCHHHPFEAYSQADYYGLAAFFTRVSTKTSVDFGALGGDTIVKIKSSGSIRHPRTRKTMLPTPLLGEPVDPSNVRDLRRPLAVWLTSKNNRLFARNIVNRIWSYFMGTGLVEPIDDMRATNPASNPELLDALADQFVTDEFDLKKLMRHIMRSRVYQLSSTPRPENVTDTRFYLHYNVKRLPAEVLLDAIDFACQTQERFKGVPLGTRAIELPDPNYASYFLDTLGRPKRVIACECERTAEPNLAQVLQLSNGELIHRKLSDKKGRIANLLAGKVQDADAVRELYSVTFSRQPSAEEIATAQQFIKGAPNRREGLEDVLWALLNSREFLFNH